jgi:hypothetical protein
MQTKNVWQPLLLVLMTSGASAQTSQSASIQAPIVKGTSIQLKRIVLDFWSKVYAYPIQKKKIPSNDCTNFYNSLVAFNNGPLKDVSKLSETESSSFAFKLLYAAYTSALNVAGECSYEVYNEIGRTKFEFYKELYDRDINFLNFVTGEY